jgi:hypothetical protein
MSTFGAGLAVDLHGNVSGYWSFSLGGGIGGYAKVTGGGTVSTANTIWDLKSDWGPYGLIRVTSVTAGYVWGAHMTLGNMCDRVLNTRAMASI